ncbi:MAG: FlgD immunoglobulin-like domain containing protein [Thermoleophilaceae bacterium]
MSRETLQGTVFALLVAATMAAFVITQRLKSAPPPIERVYYPAWISPNGDGLKDVVTLRFRLPKPGEATVQVVDAGEVPVRTLARDAPLAAGRHAYPWDGRTDGGAIAPEGVYRLRVDLSSEGRTLTALNGLTLDVTPPRPEIVAVTPRTLFPGGPPGARARGSASAARPTPRLGSTSTGWTVAAARSRPGASSVGASARSRCGTAGCGAVPLAPAPTRSGSPCATGRAIRARSSPRVSW